MNFLSVLLKIRTLFFYLLLMDTLDLFLLFISWEQKNSEYRLSFTTPCIVTKGSSVSDVTEQCSSVWGFQPTYLGILTALCLEDEFSKLLELVSQSDSPTIFDKFTANTWQDSIDEVFNGSTYDSDSVNFNNPYSSSAIRHVKRYFICQAKNMTDLLDDRPLSWYVKVWLCSLKFY